MNNTKNGVERICVEPPKHVQFGDFNILCASRQDLVDLALAACRAPQDRTTLVFDVNGHALSLARTDKTFADMIRQADIIHADGGFLVTLSKYIGGNQIPERSATTDMLLDFATSFQSSPYSFYLLGSEERVNRVCAEKLREMYPRLDIAGRRNGFFGVDEEREIVDDINASGADVLWVGLGKPKEQDFCVRWRHELKPRWTITCGGCFNYVTGEYARAPAWMQRSNLEWLHRLGTRPKELLGRYLTTSPHALWIALTDNSSRKTSSR
ncbi:exopolysaccharide biosynthesis WecB/TagA/CpsF family protein [Stenotrophomonas maltophilia]|uniref:WecB/TagA/CpsF family glycosyltransferase n=1 Tax=Stenotrophomonas chelatiphaga TaxID=517011 RepID=UPI000F4C1593|nr:WecB/TagA/CpsF family glycosyltransferase [Stenotrophomonas chelatiphaga]MCS4230398.1 exopolysaccharide biosynthesis WecB/TagA/CpsF family protein [Stenotrophomonas chelatiphaga]ROQ40328.1 exopolysaccharide biosynthesis WecB/TagA/CpsF family protein [Stenotrophomonas maltophilia]